MMANSNMPTVPWIVTVTITRYMDVNASSREAAERLAQRDLTRLHGSDARITAVQKG